MESEMFEISPDDSKKKRKLLGVLTNVINLDFKLSPRVERRIVCSFG
jgi:hypothetical protein